MVNKRAVNKQNADALYQAVYGKAEDYPEFISEIRIKNRREIGDYRRFTGDTEKRTA